MRERITADTVRHVAKIARLNLADSEVKRFQKELNDILDAFKVLDKCKAGAPSFQPVEIKNVVSEDAKEECLSQKDALKNTKHREKGFFRGPRAV